MTSTQLERAPVETAGATYTAAVVHDFGKPLVVEEVPRQPLEPGQIRVKVEATGLCHTDIHAAHGDWPVKPSPPFVPGHEGVGIVERARPGRDRGRARRPRRDAVARLRLRHVRLLRLRLGDALPRAEEHGLLDRRRLRRVRHRVRAATSSRCRRASIPFDAAPLTCAGVTTYKAVKVAGTRSSDLVAVFGVGGLGHLAIQYARDRRWPRDRSRPARREARARQGARSRVHGQRGRGGSGRGDPEARRRRPGDRAGGVPEVVRAGLRLAAARRHARLRRAARRQRGHAADLRDRAQRDHDRRLDRRHAQPTSARCSSCTPQA